MEITEGREIASRVKMVSNVMDQAATVSQLEVPEQSDGCFRVTLEMSVSNTQLDVAEQVSVCSAEEVSSTPVSTQPTSTHVMLARSTTDTTTYAARSKRAVSTRTLLASTSTTTTPPMRARRKTSSQFLHDPLLRNPVTATLAKSTQSPCDSKQEFLKEGLTVAASEQGEGRIMGSSSHVEGVPMDVVEEAANSEVESTLMDVCPRIPGNIYGIEFLLQEVRASQSDYTNLIVRVVRKYCCRHRSPSLFGLPVLHTLRLHLSDCAITSEGFVDLCEALEGSDAFPTKSSGRVSGEVPVYVRLEHNYIESEYIQDRSQRKSSDSGK